MFGNQSVDQWFSDRRKRRFGDVRGNGSSGSDICVSWRRHTTAERSNILLLRNNLSLSSGEVAFACGGLDSNSNVNNKDAGYVENQQQNIADAIDLLPRLATGIDVNIKFTRLW
ncbi:hypothetical protein L1987_85852 [Smallanthus sonchifolius]|uniref:Uncharacterized protein n=1 Tax=Smallanthus sonchifolius TaxID=185202 RepID=A0ACB8Y1V9_9ASTR|nr:hypothetical protein L1987_85852 [Smallanthus sonchifolius]